MEKGVTILPNMLLCLKKFGTLSHINTSILSTSHDSNTRNHLPFDTDFVRHINRTLLYGIWGKIFHFIFLLLSERKKYIFLGQLFVLI